MLGIEQKPPRKTGDVTDEEYMSLMRVMLSHSQMESHRQVLNLLDDACILSVFRVDHGVVLRLYWSIMTTKAWVIVGVFKNCLPPTQEHKKRSQLLVPGNTELFTRTAVGLFVEIDLVHFFSLCKFIYHYFKFYICVCPCVNMCT